MKVIVAAIIFTLLPVIIYGSGRSTQVRDNYRNLLETKESDGEETIVRDKYGDMIRTERHEGRQLIIRDNNGNIIATEEAD